MLKQPNRLWIVALLLGWAVDFLFWGQSVGVNFPIFMSLCLFGGLYWLFSNRIRPASKSLWLIISFAFFALMSFWRKEPLTAFLAYTFTFFSLGVLATTYVGGRWMQYGLVDYFKNLFQLFLSMLFEPITFIDQVRKDRIERGVTNRKLSILPIARGFLLAAPIVLCFGSLLASADMVFSQKISDFFGLFDGNRVSEYVLRLSIILLSTYLLTGIFLHAGSKSKGEKLVGEDQPLVKPFLGFTESAVVLGSVVALFSLFVLVQFQYFFGGNANIGVAGYTYSQYARRGFNELVLVAFFSLLLIMGLSLITKRENETQRRIYSGLSIAIVVLVMVILASAFQRLSLAIDWHGFSRLRLYPQVFLIWVGILLIAVVALEVFHLERYFAFAAVLASLGFAASLSLVNVDAAIVHRNVLRASQGKHFNVHHLASLSPDAVPALANEFLYSKLPTATREGVGVGLLCYLHSDPIAIKDPNQAQDWRSFNFSLWAARKSLDEVKNYLTDYHVNDERKPIRVRTPGNIVYECPTGAEAETEVYEP